MEREKATLSVKVSVVLHMKWSRSVHGDSHLLLLDRAYSEDGEPLGYRQMTGLDKLSVEHRQLFEKLPGEFGFREAQRAIDRGGSATNSLLEQCKGLELIRKLPNGKYKKLA